MSGPHCGRGLPGPSQVVFGQVRAEPDSTGTVSPVSLGDDATGHSGPAVARIIRQGGGTPQDQGRRFEIVMARAFERSPQYSQRFAQTWLWADWPERERLGFGGDSGVDIVAREHTGDLCAIQCKLYEPGSKVPTKDINSFLAEAGKRAFSSSILVCTGDLTGPAWNKIRDASKHCEVITGYDLDHWAVDWNEFTDDPEHAEFDCVTPREDQVEAVSKIYEGFEQADRGKLIMPCGTGKSLVSLWAAEKCVGPGGRVLYMVPSLALMAQTMRVWAAHRDRSIPHQYVSVCSDPRAGRRRGDHGGNLSELMSTPTTDSDNLSEKLRRRPDSQAMEVWFCTYQSAGVLTKAFGMIPDSERQKAGLDLMVCDEAHRTTGMDLTKKEREGTGSNRSPFTMCHDDACIPARKRLYQTATPRVFTDRQRAKLADDTTGSINSFSMDDECTYGKTLYEMTFAEAVELDLVSDYRVLVIGADEVELERIAAGDMDLTELPRTKEAKRAKIDTNYLAKLLGCWDAMATPYSSGREARSVAGQVQYAEDCMRTAISFSNTVNASKGIAGRDWFTLEDSLWETISRGVADKHAQPGRKFLSLVSNHIDGTRSSLERGALLSKLEEYSQQDRGTGEAGQESEQPEAMVLSNAQLLSEGVDVPALDAVLFMEPKKSPVQVTQAVGRAVRKAPGKMFGYVVIPVVIPKGFAMSDDEVLSSSDFKAVWEVVRALRSHDERVDYWVNDQRAASPIDVIVPPSTIPGHSEESQTEQLEQMRLRFQGEIESKISSRLVEECGDRQMWPSWGREAAVVCRRVRRRVTEMAGGDAKTDQAATRFGEFVDGLNKAVGGEVSREDAIDMVAQHVVTMPVFDHLFAEARFADSNPISKAFNSLLDDWSGRMTEGESFPGDCSSAADWLFGDLLRPLERNYRTMQKMFETSHTPAEKVDLLRQIYDGFFSFAMKKQVKSLGIVYTPVEIVDFMVRAVDAVSRKHLGSGLTDEGVHVLDPFAGTGTFLYRLLTVKGPDGNYLIRDKDLVRKFHGMCVTEDWGRCTPGKGVHEDCKAIELHASELVPLAYYIAALKIEAGYAERSEDGKYRLFDGIVLRDTLASTREDYDHGLLGSGLSDNATMAKIQDRRLATVVIGNPPWSSGQKSAGDDSQNIEYDDVAGEVNGTYLAKHREVTGKSPGGNAYGNLYVQAIRWASDRLHREIVRFRDGTTKIETGIVAFVHPNSLSTATSLAGMRAALRDEFTDIYVVNLRGDAYKSGEEAKAEGLNVFAYVEMPDGSEVRHGTGSRNGVQITILVSDPDNIPSDGLARLHYAKVPEYSGLRDKFDWLEALGTGTDEFWDKFEQIPIHQSVPRSDQHYWDPAPDPTFYEMPIPLCEAARGEVVSEGVAVSLHARGVATSCDAFAYDFGRRTLVAKIQSLIEEYERVRTSVHQGKISVDEAVNSSDASKIKWHGKLKTCMEQNKPLKFDEDRIRRVLYRPFQQMWLYCDDNIISAGLKNMERMFPLDGDAPADGGGAGITVTQSSQVPFGLLAVGRMPDLCLTGRQGRTSPRRS